MLSPIQEKLLEMFKWFHNYCEKEDITYYAIGGTILGAIRHNGFIPWDDDIDIAIPRKDYNKLIQNFKEVIDGYLLESPYSGNSDFLYSYAKLYDTRTTLMEKTRVSCKRGVYIDVFPLDGIGNSLEEIQKKYRKFDRRNMFLMTRTCVTRNDRRWYKNLAIIMAQMIPNFILNDKKLSIYINEIAESMNDESSKYIANLMGSYRYKEVTLRENFGKPTLYEFEGMNIYGQEKYDEYLTNLYEDWRSLPPIEKRYTKHDFALIDLKRSYL